MARFVTVAQVGELAEGQAKRVFIQGQAVALFYAEGEYYAIDDTCSHAEASLSEGEVQGTNIECPLHGSLFDLRTGRALTLPAVAPVDKYPVRIEGDAVQVGTEPE